MIIGRNCATSLKTDKEYQHPFIGCLFVNDIQFIKFCKNFKKYITMEPNIINKPVKDSVWFKQRGNNGWYYPPNWTSNSNNYIICLLDDIEIHFIHEYNKKEFLEKYKRRQSRCKETPTFILSTWCLLNNHSLEEYDSIIKEFTNIDNSIYISKYTQDCKYNNTFIVKDWIGVSESRNQFFVYDKFYLHNKYVEMAKKSLN